ncbi:MAG: 50S ribosomal protein L25 [Myxococcales bacterium]|nr:50S ribosomal protein L25 [Myxococcales bacterium]
MSITINANPRDGRGKSASRALRNDGRVPAVIYGHGVEAPQTVSLDPKDLQKAMEGPKGLNELFECVVEGGGTHKVLVRQIQRHPVKRNLLHVDLVAPDPNKTMQTMVPLAFVGKSIGVSMGGRLRTPYREVKVVAKPADFPGTIEINLTPMDIGFTLMASELSLPEGVTAIFDRDYVIAKVVKPRGKAKAEEPAKKK